MKILGFFLVQKVHFFPTSSTFEDKTTNYVKTSYTDAVVFPSPRLAVVVSGDHNEVAAGGSWKMQGVHWAWFC